MEVSKKKGREKMKEYKATTKRGQQLIDVGRACIYPSLRSIYGSYSKSKENAFNWCYNEYCNSENHTAFGIGNANTYGFTASWLCTIDNESAMRIETKENSYLVWLER